MFEFMKKALNFFHAFGINTKIFSILADKAVSPHSTNPIPGNIANQISDHKRGIDGNKIKKVEFDQCSKNNRKKGAFGTSQNDDECIDPVDMLGGEVNK